jgi:hypothetical protein
VEKIINTSMSSSPESTVKETIAAKQKDAQPLNRGSFSLERNSQPRVLQGQLMEERD